MPEAVPPEAEAFLHRGYAVIQGFLGSAEVAAMRAEVERCLTSSRGLACERPHNTLVPLRWNDRLVARMLDSPDRLSRLGETVAAHDLRWISGYLSLKQPNSPPLWWHQDWWCWTHPVSFRPEAPQVAVLCYLSPTDEHNAALRVIPRSHHASTPLHALLPEAHATDAGDLATTHPAMSDHADQKTPRLAAGDAVVVDYRLLHGTHANSTATRRECVLLTFAPSWRMLPADIRGHLIRHPALPTDDEPRPEDPWLDRLLPRHDGPRHDLPLDRTAPSDFAVRY